MGETHVSDCFEEKDGWWNPVCSCGAQLGVFPDAETACDALMEHAYAAGLADGRVDGGDHSHERAEESGYYGIG